VDFTQCADVPPAAQVAPAADAVRPPPATPLQLGTYCVFLRGLNGARGPLVGMVSVTQPTGRGSLLGLHVVMVKVNNQPPAVGTLKRIQDLPFSVPVVTQGVQNGRRYDTASQYDDGSGQGASTIAFVHDYNNQGQLIGFDAYYAAPNVPVLQRSTSQTWIIKSLVMPSL
jgi:hypothetical protein